MSYCTDLHISSFQFYLNTFDKQKGMYKYTAVYIKTHTQTYNMLFSSYLFPLFLVPKYSFNASHHFPFDDVMIICNPLPLQQAITSSILFISFLQLALFIQICPLKLDCLKARRILMQIQQHIQSNKMFPEAKIFYFWDHIC